MDVTKIGTEDFFKYFELCYEADNNRFSIENLSQAKYQYRYYLKEQEELLTGEYPIIPFFHNKEKELLSDITLYKLEKQLYYAAFFVLGVNENTFSKNSNLFAPLVLYPATIEKLDNDDISYLSINKQEGILNRLILNKLEPVSVSSSVDNFIKECESFFYEDIQDAFLLKRSLEKHFKNVDVEELMYYPKLWSRAKIYSYLKSSKEKGVFKIVPGALTSLVPKVSNSLKVITDLSKIGKQYHFGKPINRLLKRQAPRLFNDTSSVLKNRLNTGQFKALQNVQKYHNSVIVGPPGTGKSYTICSIAVDCILRGQSVLIVSKTKSAVEVLREMLVKEYRLKNYIVHTTGRGYKKSLESKLNKILSGIHSRNYLDIAYEKYRNGLHRLEEIEIEFLKRVGAEVELGAINSKSRKSIREIFRKFYIKSFTELDETLWDLFFEIEKQAGALDINLKKYILQKIDSNVKRALKEHRTSLVDYYEALVSDNFSEYKRKVDTVEFDHIFKAFPIWLAHLPELNGVLPTQKELFDVVIIDEATQCDIASALPAIYRAKKAVVVGDPKQLRHYSFISKNQQLQFRKELNLPENSFFNYRDKSILDVYIENLANQDQVAFLREHFRSPSDIIEFSNKMFYDGQLEILKVTPDVSRYAKQILIQVPDGARNEKGVNALEVEVLLSKLDDIIEKEKLNPISIGILSFFSDQVTYLKKVLRTRYDLKTLKRFNLLCATPYEFQGSERDVMLISLCVDNTSHHSAFRHINKPDVLNVGITRAKQLQYIFSSLNNNELDSESLLFNFLSFWEEEVEDYRSKIPDNEFQYEVFKGLKERGYEEILIGFPLGGQILDILVLYKGKRVFIDLVGDSGEFADHFSLERYKTFARIGILSFPLHYSFWKKKPDLFFEKLERLFLFDKI